MWFKSFCGALFGFEVICLFIYLANSLLIEVYIVFILLFLSF